ncbi:MAG TPA: histidine--tRNA ligase [Rhizomicrobium sp.]|jgi:histidyl-tRNA synthetase|nr:histidine--tRNA ligase [Rhizomicrobium sp.]
MHEQKSARPKARVPRGFRDRGAGGLAAERACLDTIRRVYESWGFEALETPAFEYTDALGKFLPDLDRPNEGVFSLQDEDGQWLSLRYDLTAPLARYVAENFQHLPKPFRRYQVGSVWRNEKPGPGRYREFTQFDADTVGSASPAADAELLMMTCDALETLGLRRNEYVIKINSRKLLDSFLDAINVDATKRGIVLRAIDKLDRLGAAGVRALLGSGRRDESGDIAAGADLEAGQIDRISQLVAANTYSQFREQFVLLSNDATEAAFRELQNILNIVADGGLDDPPIRMDATVVRGLDYYTGAVFEAQLTFPVANEAGETIVFGSVAGGGRYDNLVARFTGQQVAATGISIGVSRLLTALKGRAPSALPPLVLVLALDEIGNSFRIASELRQAGIRAETYVGGRKFGDQLKYADRRGAAIAVIEGADERARGEVTLKDLALGAELAKSVESRAAWVADRPAQISVARADLVARVGELIGRSSR